MLLKSGLFGCVMLALAAYTGIAADSAPAADKEALGKYKAPPVEQKAYPAKKSVKKWTLLVYANGNNSGEAETLAFMNELERFGTSRNIATAAELGRAGKTRIDGGWSGARRYKLKADSNMDRLNSPYLDLGKKNMTSPAHLAEFINWGKKSFPARRYMLLVWSAGGKGICYDSETKKTLSPEELAGAIAKTGGVDVYLGGMESPAGAKLTKALKSHARLIFSSNGGLMPDFYGFLAALNSVKRITPEGLRDLARDYIYGQGSDCVSGSQQYSGAPDYGGNNSAVYQDFPGDPFYDNGCGGPYSDDGNSDNPDSPSPDTDPYSGGDDSGGDFIDADGELPPF